MMTTISGLLLVLAIALFASLHFRARARRAQQRYYSVFLGRRIASAHGAEALFRRAAGRSAQRQVSVWQ